MARYVLPVGVKLNSVIVAVHIGVLHACLEGARQSQIDGQIDEVEAKVAADLRRGITGAIVDDDIIIFRRLFPQLLDRAGYTCLLVVSGNDDQR